jgi:hypothetical protein
MNKGDRIKPTAYYHQQFPCAPKFEPITGGVVLKQHQECRNMFFVKWDERKTPGWYHETFLEPDAA